MLIVEGPDGGGKTTLIARLSEGLSLPVADRVVSKDAEAMVDLKAWVDSNLHSGFQPVIYDRHRLISEPIYGPVLRKHMEPGFEDPHWLASRQRLLRKINPIIIWCLPPLEDVLKNVDGDADNFVISEHIETIYWLYFNAACTWPGNYSGIWDYTEREDPDPYETMLAFLKSWIGRWQHHEH